MTLSLRAFTHQVKEDTGIDRLKKGDYVRVVTLFSSDWVSCFDVDDLVNRSRTPWYLHLDQLEKLPWCDEVMNEMCNRICGRQKQNK